MSDNSSVSLENPSHESAKQSFDEFITSFYGDVEKWKVFAAVVATFTTGIIILCCCTKFRIPRTKQEIEADYIRGKIARKFQKHLRLIQNSEMDDMTLEKALDRVRADFYALELIPRDPKKNVEPATGELQKISIIRTSQSNIP